MVELKGKFVTLTAALMGVYQDARDKADHVLFQSIGKHWNELDPEGWYDIDHYQKFLSAYIQASPTKEKAMVTLGRNIYPTIKRTTGLPPHLTTPLDYIEFEAQGYLQNHRGVGAEPRKFLRSEEGYVAVQIDKVHNCLTMEGVYLGILELVGTSSGTVEHEKCIKHGDTACELHIIW